MGGLRFAVRRPAPCRAPPLPTVSAFVPLPAPISPDVIAAATPGADAGGAPDGVAPVATLSLDVEVLRGALVESRHRVHAAVVDARGRLVACAGDPGRVAWWRSCAKPFQVMRFVREGGLERFGWDDRMLALACASHGGEPEHLALADRMLASCGCGEGDLACGPHEPLTARGLAHWRASGGPLTRLHNNCSGKHAAMLARAVAHQWPTAGYDAPTHPVQREALAEVAHWSGLEADGIPVAVDGCGVSVFALPLPAMALAYARLGVAARDGTDPAAARIVGAMTRHPFLVGGTERFDSVLMEAAGGRVVAKVGAEGVHSVAVPGLGLGFAVKVEDGAARAQGPAVLALLRWLGALPEPAADALRSLERPPVLDTRGGVVGEVVVAISTGERVGTLSAGTDR